MKQKFTVVVVSSNGLQGEVYQFDSLEEAEKYAEARRELFDMLNNDSSWFMKNVHKPRIYISTLCELKKKKKQKQRCNEINEQMTGDIQRKMEHAYMRQIHKRVSQQDMGIIKCYEQAGLAHKLYECLVEEDDERLRETVQNLADEILNEDVMPVLIDIGYQF